MKCDELRIENACVYGPDAKVYLAEQVDAAIAELKEKLMPCLNGDCILTCEVVEKYGKENAELKQKLQDQCISCPVKMQEDDVVAELKQKLENVQASMYADVVDANMENRRLKCALWIARAEMARTSAWVFWNRKDDYNYNKWKKIEFKCLKKVEEYK